MSDDDLKDLLKKLRAKNETSNITGMLLYLDPFFIQVLEGEEAIVNKLFDNIKQDSRHYKVSLSYKKPINERAFPNWTMGFNKITDDNSETIEGFSDFWQRPTAEFFSAAPGIIEKLFDKFRNETLF